MYRKKYHDFSLVKNIGMELAFTR